MEATGKSEETMANFAVGIVSNDGLASLRQLHEH